MKTHTRWWIVLWQICVSGCVILERPSRLDTDVPDTGDTSSLDSMDVSFETSPEDSAEEPADLASEIQTVDAMTGDTATLMDAVDVTDVSLDRIDRPDAGDVTDVPNAMDRLDVSDVLDVQAVDRTDVFDVLDVQAVDRTDVFDVLDSGDVFMRDAGTEIVDASGDVVTDLLRDVVADIVADTGGCAPAMADCDRVASNGCETNLQNDAMNCGLCARACAAGQTCFGGTCGVQRSCLGTATPGCGVVSIEPRPVATFAVGDNEPCTAVSGQNCTLDASPAIVGVRVSAFDLDAYEVTVARFRVFWAARPGALAEIHSRPIAYPDGRRIVWEVASATPPAVGANFNWSTVTGARERHPMNGVDWWLAQEFCVWDGGRLPTEAEWEYVARGRHLSVVSPLVGRDFPWGNATPLMCDRAHWQGCTGEDGAPTRAVGSFDPSLGVYDLAGNVSEWNADFWNISRASCWGATRVDPMCLITPGAMSDPRAVRGGSWFSNGFSLLRSASRIENVQTRRSEEIGFRCVR
jgi:formylglycine-generating enzyme